MGQISLLDELLAPEQPQWQQQMLERISNPYARELMREALAPKPPEAPIRAGALKQFGYGVRDLPVKVYNRVAAAVTGEQTQYLTDPDPVTTSEKVARFAGSLVPLVVTFALAPVAKAVGIAGAAIGTAIAPIVKLFGLNPLAIAKIGAMGAKITTATKIGTGVAAGAATGALRAFAEKQDVAKGAGTGALWGGGFSLAGSLLTSPAMAGFKASVMEKVTGKSVLGDRDAMMKILQGSSNERQAGYLSSILERFQQHQHLLPSKIREQIASVLSADDVTPGDKLLEAMRAGETNIHGRLIFRDVTKDIATMAKATGLLAQQSGRGFAAFNRLLTNPATELPEIEMGSYESPIAAGSAAKQLGRIEVLQKIAKRAKDLVVQTRNEAAAKGIDTRATGLETKLSRAEQAFALKMADLEKAELSIRQHLGDLFNVSRHKMPTMFVSDYVSKEVREVQVNLEKIWAESYPDKVVLPNRDLLRFMSKHPKVGAWTTFEEVKRKATELYGPLAGEEMEQIAANSDVVSTSVGSYARSLLHEGAVVLPKTGKVAFADPGEITIIDIYDLVTPKGDVVSPTRDILGKPVADALRNAGVAYQTHETELGVALNPVFKPLIAGTAERIKASSMQVLKILDKGGIPDDELVSSPLFDPLNPGRFISFKTLSAAAKETVKNMGVKYGFLAADASDDTVMGFADSLRAAQASRVALTNFAQLVGLPEDKFLQNYFPHIIKALMTGKDPNKIDSVMQKLMKLGPAMYRGVKTEGEWHWPHELAREFPDVPINEKTMVTDVYSALRKYFTTGLRIKFLTPTVDALKPLRAAMDPGKQAYYDRTVQALGKIPGEWEKGLRRLLSGVFEQVKGRELTEGDIRNWSSVLANAQYHGTIWYNPFSAVKNLTQQILPVFQLDDDPSVGASYWVKARQLLNTDFGKWIREINPIIGSRQFSEGLRLQYDILSKFPSIVQRFDRGGFEMFRRADIANVNTSFMMDFLYNLDRGAAVADALDDAVTFTMSTQFMYGFDSPEKFKNPVGKQLGILMSWPINWMRMLAKNASAGEKTKIAGTLAGMAVASEVLSLSGFSFRSIHPTEVAQKFLPVAMITDEDNWPALPKNLATGIRAIQAKLFEQDPNVVDEAVRKWLRSFQVLVPAGVQGERLINFLKASYHDWKAYDYKNRLRYEMTEGGLVHQLSSKLPYMKMTLFPEMGAISGMGLQTQVRGEALRGLFGPTVEGRQRQEQLDLANSLTVQYRRNRYEAINAYIKGDTKKFTKYQSILDDQFASPVGMEDIQAELELRTKSALIRRVQGLPQDVQRQVLETLGTSLTRESPFQTVMNRRLAKYGIKL